MSVFLVAVQLIWFMTVASLFNPVMFPFGPPSREVGK